MAKRKKKKLEVDLLSNKKADSNKRTAKMRSMSLKGFDV
jgi:hypothetical protein